MMILDSTHFGDGSVYLLISDIVWVNLMELWGLWSWLFMAVGTIH